MYLDGELGVEERKRVQERLKKMPARHRYQSILFRYIVPTFGLAVIIYYLFNLNSFKLYI